MPVPESQPAVSVTLVGTSSTTLEQSLAQPTPAATPAKTDSAAPGKYVVMDGAFLIF